MHGGSTKDALNQEDLTALGQGVPNLLRHVSNIKNVYHLPCVVAINKFPTDTEAEVGFIIEKCKDLGVNVVLSDVWAKGGQGGVELAQEVVRLCEQNHSDFTYSYDVNDSIENKLTAIVQRIYGGKGINILPSAQKQISELSALGFGHLPVCIAKTQYSFSDNPSLLGAPTDFTVTIKNVKVSAGAAFLVALTGDIMTMPGLPKSPAAERIDVDENGVISGLF
jgi:formate--tetrahydrofolate ligase